MRDLKFRALYRKNNKVYMVSTLFFDKEFNCYSADLIDKKTNKRCFQAYSGEFELMQYTGLKDKNGLEIYFEDYVEDEAEQIWLVKWNKTAISLLNISTGDIMSIRNNLTIKSNLYENTFKFTPKYTEIS